MKNELNGYYEEDDFSYIYNTWKEEHENNIMSCNAAIDAISDGVKEAEREKLRKHIIDGGYIEDMVYITEEEIQQKIEAHVYSLGIDPAVLFE